MATRRLNRELNQTLVQRFADYPMISRISIVLFSIIVIVLYPVLFWLGYASREHEVYELTQNLGGVNLITSIVMMACVVVVVMPHFYVLPRDDKERSLLNNMRNAKYSSSHMKGQTYSDAQALLRPTHGTSNVLLSVCLIALTIFFYYSGFFVYSLALREPVTDKVAVILGSLLTSILFFRLMGLYLRTGSYARTYAHVLKVHDEVRTYRREKSRARVKAKR